ncbi:MAG: quinolinate synthase NadA [Armatimonadetes bacterium]|nr:quinolinate synthase NadA [Armatimonadota bacterium]
MAAKKEIEELKRMIVKLKRKKGAIILAHNYQREEVQDVADFIGDSLELSRTAAQTDSNFIVFCGVRFMAETAKILSPKKLVVHPVPMARCPMADMVTADDILELRKEYPRAKFVCYVNTNADVKAECDVCCTSANAVQVLQRIDADEIVFVPDRNLALYARRFVKDKSIIPWNGWCYVHKRIGLEEVKRSKEMHQDALLVVHPECNPEVIDIADEVKSTGGMVKLASESNHRKFLIGTEEGLIRRLRREHPDKIFMSAGTPRTCYNMKLITLHDVYEALINESPEVELPEDILRRARGCVERMLQLV